MIRSLICAAIICACPVWAWASPATVGAAGKTAVHAQELGATIDRLAEQAGRLPANRRANVVRPLRALGPDALDPLLARLGADSPAMVALHGKSAAAYDTFVAALIEALSVLRSPRAEPVLTRLFEAPATAPLVTRMAAEGLGRLCTDSTRGVLAKHVKEGDSLEIAAETGLGLCRTEAAATLLTTRLAAQPTPETARALALALGTMGSSWAWQALGKGAEAEGRRVRSLASPALLHAYPLYDGAAREALKTAVLMIDDPAAAEVVAQLPSGDGLRGQWMQAHGE